MGYGPPHPPGVNRRNKYRSGTGCSISLNRSDGSVALMGPKSKLDAAEDAVKKTADKFDQKQANMTTDEMEIDADDVGVVVGKQGSTVKYIQRTSGADKDTIE